METGMKKTIDIALCDSEARMIQSVLKNNNITLKELAESRYLDNIKIPMELNKE